MDGLCFNGGKSTYDELIKSGKINSKGLPIVDQGRDGFCKKLPETISFADEVLTKCREPFDKAILIKLLTEAKFSQTFYCSTDSTGKYCYEVIGRPYLEHRPFSTLYSQWAPSVCASTCVAEVDKALKEFVNDVSDLTVKFNNFYIADFDINPELYSGKIYNPVSCCVSDDGTFGAENICKPENINADSTPSSIIANANNTATTINTNNNPSTDVNTNNVPSNININSNSTSGANSLSAQIALLSIILCFIFTLFK